MAFLDAISTQTALALENARLVQETERRVRLVAERFLGQLRVGQRIDLGVAAYPQRTRRQVP